MKVEVKLEERISKKTNQPYKVLVIRFENGYEKLVFLTQPELYMLGAK